MFRTFHRLAVMLLLSSPYVMAEQDAKVSQNSHPGMIHLPGGEFLMGSEERAARPDERPVHRVKVSPFWLDETEVTNAEFRRFVEATHYVTTAEKTPTQDEILEQLPPGTPPPSADTLVPGALVFDTPKQPGAYWWKWVAGANWRHPEGPNSTLSDSITGFAGLFSDQDMDSVDPSSRSAPRLVFKPINTSLGPTTG